jgi:KUP system potassium uptake protein
MCAGRPRIRLRARPIRIGLRRSPTGSPLAAPLHPPAPTSAADVHAPETGAGGGHARGPWLGLAIGAAGIVFGDIGTSPLYTWSEIRRHGALNTTDDILGAASLIFWTLTLIAFGKYVGLVLRADNNGEGGTFALLSQVQRLTRPGAHGVAILLMFASALLYGEGLITPAISVLSAVEGIAVADPRLAWLIVPTTIGLLTGLFAVQYHGTARVGRLFGGVMVLWFVTIGALGAVQVARFPEILPAVLPHHGLAFLARNGITGDLAVLGSVVLCITGGEALFADMGHFGAQAIRRAWVGLVYPALLLSYFGQGAKLLSGEPIVRDNVFFSLVPAPAMFAMVALATCAAIIASQALISGAFSLTRSAINLGLLPRVAVVHTNREIEGQIYMPVVNWGLWLGCCWLVVEFQRQTELAAAYGLAVMGTMTITSVAMIYIARFRWGWSWWTTVPVFGTFLLIELAFLVANVVKIPSGAWLPLVIGGILFAAMRLWRRSRRQLGEAYARVARIPVQQLIALKRRMPELSRAMVFLTQERVHGFDDPVPLVLLKFLDRYGALPRHVTMFSIVPEPVPFWREKRYDVRQFGDNVTSVQMHVGYMEQPNTRAALVHLKQQRQIRIHATRWTIVMGREELIIEPGSLWWRIPYQLFGLLQQLGSEAHVWFGLGGDTGISKEVIPVRVSQNGVMEVVVRPPEVDMAWQVGDELSGITEPGDPVGVESTEKPPESAS